MSISQGGISNSSPIPDDLVAIYQGGEYFLDRMKVFEKSKAESAAAYSQLQLGNEILGAQAEAQAKTEAAAKLHEDATAALEKANAQATATIYSAKVQAEAVLVAAQQKHDELVGSAATIRSDAEAYLAQSRADADAMLKEATDRLQEAIAKETAAQVKSDSADAAQASAAAAKDHHDTIRAVYERKMEQIAAVMAGS